VIGRVLEESVTERERVTPTLPDYTFQSSSAPQPGPIVIEPSDAWKPISLRDIWNYRELLYFLIWRDLKIRYKQTILGVIWVILQPLLMTVIFTIFLGMLARVPSKEIPYALLVYTGLMPWTFFSNSIVYSGNSLTAQTNLVTKVYFPRAIIPAAAVGARLVDFGVAFLMMIGLMFYYGIVPSWHLLMLPVFVVLITMLSLGLGLWSSALNVRYRDVGIMLPVLIQVWMFVSPVVYPLDLVPQRWLWLYSFNPMAGIIEGFRSSLLNRPFNWLTIGIAALITVGLLLYSMFVFKRMERYFADLV
jgi:lipopolysaccharide transport system permease protein